MDNKTLKTVAQQLRKPEGEYALQVAEKMNEGNALINRYTIAFLDIKPGEHILEIGMGNGFFVPEILGIAPDVQYTGCDFSEAMIEEASKRNAAFIQSGQAKFHLSEAAKMPLKNDSVDKIFTVNTLYFWEDPEAVFAEFRRVMKPQGQLAIAVRPKSMMAKYPFVRVGGFQLFSKDELIDLVTQNGFTVREVLEKEEPAQVVSGERIEVSSLIVKVSNN
ncbi:MAG: methyltransferase [Saprospiraceae bacterium]|nr:MAG: methyltransferase [Saprospiraceae bacterium]